MTSYKEISMVAVFVFATCAYAQQPYAVRAVYLTPSDISEPLEEQISLKRNILIDVQRFYGKEMSKHGYGYKTFDLEKGDNNRVVIHKVKGKKTLREYSNTTFILNEIDDTLGQDFSVKDIIRVVFLTGAEKVHVGAYNLQRCLEHWQGNINNVIDRTCKEYSMIPADRTTLMSFLTAHELGHAFGLMHNPDGITVVMNGSPKPHNDSSFDLDLVFLSEDETKWLDVHPYFNRRDYIKSTPKVTKATKWELNTGFIRIVFGIKNKNELHHSQLVSKSRDEVVGWGDLNAENSTIEFNVHRRMFLKSDKVVLHLIDIEGNRLTHELDIELNDVPAAPSKPKVKTVIIWAELKADLK